MDKKRKRAFQRLVSGLQIARNENAYMRFMTLTSPRGGGKRSIRKSFDVLKLCIKRATLERDGFLGFKFNRYFCIRTAEGNGVLHVIFWGRFIPQAWLSSQWERIHGAFRVDIRACHTVRKRVNGLVGYLLTEYVSKQPIERMSYGWLWAWLGVCKSWSRVKDRYGMMRRGKGVLSARIIHVRAYEAFYTVRHSDKFKDYFVSRSVEAWHSLLWEHPLGSRQKKLVRWLC